MFFPNDNTQHDHSTVEALNSTIHQAAANDDLAKVSILLDGGFDINTRDQSFRTALHLANSSPMVRLLLSRGADTTLRDIGTCDEPEGFIPIENAARFNALAAMQELIAHGVDVESSRAIFLAARENHMDMLGSLFDTISSKMSDARNQRAVAEALRVSAKNQNLEMVQFILRKLGGELEADTRDEYWQGALDRAILSVLDCDCCDGDGGLLDYVRDQQWDHAIRIIDVLIEAGASINTYCNDPTKCTVLHCAVYERGPPLELITFLLHHGADPNSRDSSGRSPFFEILGSPNATEELVKMFTDAGAVLGPPTTNGQTPLHVVRNPKIASWLIASGADIAAVDDQGETPLHKSSSPGRPELVSLYLNAGTPIDVQNKMGWTPFMQSQSAQVSKALFDHGADIHTATEQGITALHHAASICNLELVSFLLEHGAHVHARAARKEPTCGSDGWTTTIVLDNTPLHLVIASCSGALMGETMDVVTALLDHGADIEAKEGTGKTPLLLAISREFDTSMRSWAHNEKVVNYLLERGADRHAVDDAGNNAVQLADNKNYVFSDVGRYERKPIPLRSWDEINTGPGRGRGRGAYGRGNFNS